MTYPRHGVVYDFDMFQLVLIFRWVFQHLFEAFAIAFDFDMFQQVFRLSTYGTACVSTYLFYLSGISKYSFRPGGRPPRAPPLHVAFWVRHTPLLK